MPGKRLSGTAREDLREDLRADYEAGDSVRMLAQEYGRSYGQTHKLLREAGTSMRPRGGVHGSTRKTKSN
jgi:hypothetical protein